MRKMLWLCCLSLLLGACRDKNQIRNWEGKVKFDLSLLKNEGENSNLHGYTFCVPGEPMLVEQLRLIHKELEVVDQPQRLCDSGHFRCSFAPVSQEHLPHLKKIARLSYVKEIHPIWAEENQ